MRVEFCASCGGPLEARWSEIVIQCTYCGGQNAPGGKGSPVPSSVPDDGRPRLAVAGRTYVLQGRLGRGDACDVYRGRWVRRLGELVVLKIQRASQDGDLIRREWSLLKRLHASPAHGADHFVARLPQPIALAPLVLEGQERIVAVYQWHSGFNHPLDQVFAEHAEGVSGRVVVWIMKRLLEILSFAHRSGVVHGAIIPSHVLVHPRDHGAMLIGWSTATAWSTNKGERLPALSSEWESYYPRSVVDERWVSPATDLAMAARCALSVGGATSFDDPGPVPGGLGRLLVRAAQGEFNDAWALREQVGREGSDVYGPPRYSPLEMPGWSFGK
jgi:serine/threonine protein kinase